MGILKVCCFPDCETRVEGPHVACTKHWHSLPARVQVAVQTRIRGWRDMGAAREFVVSWLHNSAMKGMK